MVSKVTWGAWALAAACALASPAALAAENFQTDLGPTPLDGSNRPNVLGRGSALAILDGTKFTVHGTFSGLATQATTAHLCLAVVMGGKGPAIFNLTVTQAQKGQVSGTVTLTPDQVAALKAGRIYLLLNSQKAPNGNLWGWFQPAHRTVGPNEPEYGSWYIPNILENDNAARKKPQG